MRVIIAGGRDFDDFDLLSKKCDSILRNQDNVVVISGNAKGADELGEKYARSKNYNILIFKADWEKLGKSAGPIRNRRMAEEADALIAFWDGKSKGTKHMIDTANNLKLKVRVIKY